MTLKKIISIFLKKPAVDKFLLIQVFCLLGIIRMALLMVQFNKLAGMLGEPNKESEAGSDQINWNYAYQITRYIRNISTVVPWDSKCLAQAIAGKILLRRQNIGCTVFFGVKKGEGGSTTSKLEAHAWLSVGENILLGGENAHEFVRISSFT